MVERRTVPSGPVQGWDLSHAQVNDADQAIVAMTEAFRRYGVASVEWGYRGVGPDDADPDPHGPVTYFCQVEVVTKVRRRRRVTRMLVEECVAEPGGMSGEQAQVEAGARLIRRLGGDVRIAMVDSN